MTHLKVSQNKTLRKACLLQRGPLVGQFKSTVLQMSRILSLDKQKARFLSAGRQRQRCCTHQLSVRHTCTSSIVQAGLLSTDKLFPSVPRPAYGECHFQGGAQTPPHPAQSGAQPPRGGTEECNALRCWRPVASAGHSGALPV